MLDQRGQLLRAAVGFAECSMPSYDRALHALRTWLDTWAGIGHVAVGMHRQCYDLQLTQYDERGWRATFYTTGMEHSPTSATGTGWERTPWHAVQRAAWEAFDESGRAMNYMQGLALRLAICTLVIAGCTAHGLVGTLPSLPDPDQAAEIVVIREWRYMGAAANFTVVLDGVPLYGLAVDEHVVLRVPPGDHVVTISRRGPLLNDAGVAVRAEPKRRYYYRLETNTLSSDISLLPAPATVAEGLITKTRRVE